MSSTRQFIIKLVQLTNRDKIKWQRAVQNMNSAEYKGWSFYTEMFRGDHPYLEFHTPQGKAESIKGYGLGIEELNNSILCQYKRLKVYEYGPEHEKKIKEAQQKRKEEDARKMSDFESFLYQFDADCQKEKE